MKYFKNSNLFILSLLFININCCTAQFNYNPTAQLPLDTAYRTGTLQNGIKYIIRRYKIPEQKASFYAFFDIGTINEQTNEYGFAHLLEHLCTTPRINNHQIENYYQYFEQLGVRMSPNLQATTTWESTYYTVLNVPAQKVGTSDTALLLLKEITFNPCFDSAQFEKHIRIIREEWRLNCDAEARMNDEARKMALKGTGFSRPGLLESGQENHFTLEAVKNFYNTWYQPGNLTIIAIGDFDSRMIETSIKQVFNTVPKGNISAIKTDFLLSEITEPIVNIVSDPEAENHEIKVHFRHSFSKATYTQQKLKEEFIDKIIKRMLSERLDKICKSKDSPFSEASADLYDSYFHIPNYNDYLFQVTTQKNPQLALKAILTENERIIKYGFTEKEFTKYKDWLLDIYTSNKISELPSSEIFINCFSYILRGKIPTSIDFQYNFIKSILPTLSLNEINNRYKEYTSKIKPVISLLCKQNGYVPSVQDIRNTLDSVSITKIAPYVENTDGAFNPKLFNVPARSGVVKSQTINNEMGTTEWILSNGIHVVIKTTNFNKDEIQFAGFCVFDSNKVNKDYLSILQDGLYSVKSTGLGNLSDSQIRKMLKDKSISIDYVYQEEKQGLQGSSSLKDFETALQLINLSFSDQSWNSKDTIRLAFMMTVDAPLSIVFNDTVNKYSSNRKVEDWKNMPLEKINKIYKEVFSNPAGFTFIFSGNFKSNEVKPLIEKYLGSLYPTNNHEITDKTSENQKYWWETNRKSCEFKKHLKIPSATIFIRYQGKFNPTISNSLYCNIAQRMLNKQIENVIREKHGATYAVGNYLNAISCSFAQFSIIFNTNPLDAENMKAIAFEEVKKFMEGNIDESEFNIWKQKTIKHQTDELLSNKWWVNSALYEFYFHHKNVVTEYKNETNSISIEGFRKFVKDIYKQGNAIDVIMKPQ